ncbi:MAG: hypothetical protein LDL15_04735 [Yonghaparkia sp.]|nr:hypothetical protein [Microcella sp.]
MMGIISRRIRTGAVAIVCTALLVSAGISPAVAAERAVGSTALLPETSSVAPAADDCGSTLCLEWERRGGTLGKPIATSSPTVGTLDNGGPAVIVGDRAGNIWALHLSDGSWVPGWPVKTGGIVVDSTPSVFGSGDTARVYVGVGGSASPSKGGIWKIRNTGAVMWKVTPRSHPTQAGTSGVKASVSLGNLRGPSTLDAYAPTMGQLHYALATESGKNIPGFWWVAADSTFSTAALADLYGTGRDYVIVGADSTAGTSYFRSYGNGGALRILKPTGRAGEKYPNRGLVCERRTNQVVQSSPAVGPVLADGRTGIAFGTGTFYPNQTATKFIFMINDRCGDVWRKQLDGSTASSPAFADIKGDGTLDVVIAARVSSSSTSVWALEGPNGATIWRASVTGGVIGSVVTADLGNGYQSVLVPTTSGLRILDGRTGEIVHSINGIGLQNSPLVTARPDGTVGVTLAGYVGELVSGRVQLRSVIRHYSIPGSDGATVDDLGSWPMFHRDPQLTGTAPLTTF